MWQKRGLAFRLKGGGGKGISGKRARTRSWANQGEKEVVRTPAEAASAATLKKTYEKGMKKRGGERANGTNHSSVWGGKKSDLRKGFIPVNPREKNSGHGREDHSAWGNTAGKEREERKKTQEA